MRGATSRGVYEQCIDDGLFCLLQGVAIEGADFREEHSPGTLLYQGVDPHIFIVLRRVRSREASKILIPEAGTELQALDYFRVRSFRRR